MISLFLCNQPLRIGLPAALAGDIVPAIEDVGDEICLIFLLDDDIISAFVSDICDDNNTNSFCTISLSPSILTPGMLEGAIFKSSEFTTFQKDSGLSNIKDPSKRIASSLINSLYI